MPSNNHRKECWYRDERPKLERGRTSRGPHTRRKPWISSRNPTPRRQQPLRKQRRLSSSPYTVGHGATPSSCMTRQGPPTHAPRHDDRALRPREKPTWNESPSEKMTSTPWCTPPGTDIGKRRSLRPSPPRPPHRDQPPDTGPCTDSWPMPAPWQSTVSGRTQRLHTWNACYKTGPSTKKRSWRDTRARRAPRPAQRGTT